MQDFAGLLALALMVVIIGVVALGMFRRNYDLVSWRSFFLLGFIHFYCLSTYFTAKGVAGPAFIHTPTGGYGALAASMVLFLLLFLLSAGFAFRRPSLGRWVPKLGVPITGAGVVSCALILSVTALFFSIPFFNYFGVFVSQIRGQLSACAVGLATYYLIARRFNPASWALLLTVVFLGLITSTVGTAGRRMLLSVLIAAPWMWYFTVWRYRAPITNLARVAVVFVLGVLAIIIYSPLRAAEREMDMTKSTISRRTEQFVQIFTDPKIDTEIIKYILYTDTAGNTLWVLENYPDLVPFEPFQGLKWFLANPIPRTLWANKPAALGATMSQVLHVEIKNFSFGPGIIGHGWSEGWYIGVAGYAIFFGLLCGILDRGLFDRATNPYFVAAIGCTLGNVFALPRGDTPLFLIQITGGIISCVGMLWLSNMLYGRFWAAFPPLQPPGSAGQPASVDQTDLDFEEPHAPDPDETENALVAPSERW